MVERDIEVLRPPDRHVVSSAGGAEEEVLAGAGRGAASAAGLGPTAPGAQKPRVVVPGTGWAGCRLMKGIDTRLYDVVCISTAPGSYLLLARCTSVDADGQAVHCQTVADGGARDTSEPWRFRVSDDELVMATGAEASTFGVHGVKEHAIFLRQVNHAQEIRRKLLLNLSFCCQHL